MNENQQLEEYDLSSLLLFVLFKRLTHSRTARLLSHPSPKQLPLFDLMLQNPISRSPVGLLEMRNESKFLNEMTAKRLRSNVPM